MALCRASRTASGGGHTLHYYDLGMILASRKHCVSDGGHCADVMKKVRRQITGVKTPAGIHAENISSVTGFKHPTSLVLTAVVSSTKVVYSYLVGTDNNCFA
jgi:hypothetical protein